MAIDYDKYILSTGTHWISNSGHDESGKYHGGAAGDQTGTEWQLRSWYNRPWSVVLRHPDAGVRRLIAEFGIEAALNNNIGYDQYQRTTYWTQLVKAGYQPCKVAVKCEADCTAGVTANVKAAGYILGLKGLQNIELDTYSGNMKARFVAAGFKALTANKYLSSGDWLEPGDVLLYEGHHAATNVTRGKKLAAGAAVATSVRVTGEFVNIRKTPGTDGVIMGVARGGLIMPYLGQTDANGWHWVEYKGSKAWISGKYSQLIYS